MELDREVHPPQGHVLHDQGVDPGVDQFAGRAFGLAELVVPEQRVERGVDAHPEAVGILDHAGDLRGGVPGSLTGSETGPSDIDGIGPGLDGRHGRCVIPGRSQEFNGFQSDGILHKNKTILGIVL